MRTIVFFDLPNVFYKDKKNYIKFRKYLLYEGFIMMQESVYSKLTLNSIQSDLLVKRIKTNCPKKGIVQVMTITEKQYSSIEYLIGDSTTKVINNEERLLIL